LNVANNILVLPHVSTGTIDLSTIKSTHTFFTGGLPAPSWLIKWPELEIGEQIAKGSTGTFYSAKWNNTQVVVEVLANQKLNECEFLQLIKDQLIVRYAVLDALFY
jgi:hypothetical protein